MKRAVVERHERLVIPDAVRVRMVEISRDLRRASTIGERLLWERLRGRRLAGRKFRRQHVIGSFVVDFFCADERLIVEVDGGVHENEDQRSADAERQQLLESLGFRFVRVSDELVRMDIEEALTRISAQLSSEAAPVRSAERGSEGEIRSSATQRPKTSTKAD